MILATIVLGKQNTDLNKKRINFGSYAMVYIGTKNIMKIISAPSIALNDSKK